VARLDWLIARPIAHRGYHDRHQGRVENTLSAARAAMARDFAIECDLQLSSDGVPVLFHDDTLDRLTTRVGPMRNLSLAELQALKLRDTNDRIPALAELLAIVAGKVPLVIELKSRWDDDRRLEAAVAPLLADYEGPVVVMSFDPASMAAMRRLMPDLPRGLVADHFDAGEPEWRTLSPVKRFALRHLFAAPSVAPGFVSYGLAALPTLAPVLLHRLGLKLITWTVRSRAEAVRARRYVDQITFEGFDPEA